MADALQNPQRRGRLSGGDSAMTMTNGSPTLIRRRRVKFTPQVIEKIKDLVAEGISRDDIANLLGSTVGSLQVTCSRLGISLCSRLGISLRRIILPNGSGRHTADVRGRTIPTPGVNGIAHVREQKEVSQPAAHAAPSARFAITMRRGGKDRSTDIPLPSAAIEALALEAMSRDLDIAGLVGQILAAAINKDMIQKILRGEVRPSSA
jgi:hypothetical protein